MASLLQVSVSTLYELWRSWNPWSVLLLAVSCLLFVRFMRRPYNLPPGPRGWPIIGNLLSLRKDGALMLTDWARKYGDIMTIYRGTELTILLNNYDVVKEAFVRMAKDFSDRPIRRNALAKVFVKGFAKEPYGPTFKEHRKFTAMNLRDFGTGKRSLEGKILEEARALRDEISAKDSESFCIAGMIQNAVANVICSVIFGSRYEYDDQKFADLLYSINALFSAPADLRMLPLKAPLLMHVPGLNKSAKNLVAHAARIRRHIQNKIKEHEESFDPNDIRDFIDAFLLERNNQERKENTTFTEARNVTIVAELFFAGTETAATTLRWALLYMILHPDIQDKVQQEIDSVIGQNQDPSMVHRSQMPYTEATLTEVSRLATVAPVGFAHATANDTKLRGYSIQKGTVVRANFWAIHHDPQLWPEPYKFDPTRFLDDTGKFVKRDEVIPFSIGPRVCLGEHLARMELFLFFTSMLQRFNFKLPEGAPIPPEKGVFGKAHVPVPFQLVAESRS